MVSRRVLPYAIPEVTTEFWKGTQTVEGIIETGLIFFQLLSPHSSKVYC